MSGSTIGFEALSQIVNSILDSPSVMDDSLETQSKMLHLIVTHGIRSSHTPKEVDSSQWLKQCLSAIDKIVEKTPLLLNQREKDSDTVIFKWILQSLIPLLSTIDEVLINTVKQTVITIIHAIAFKLSLFSYKREIKNYFLSTLDVYLQDLFKSPTEEKLLANLSITTNLFSILTNAEIRDQLLLDPSYDQKFETVSRKLDYAISGLSNSNNLIQLDAIKSNMVMNLLDYCLGGEYIHFTRLKLLLDYFNDLLHSSYINKFQNTQTSFSFALLFCFNKLIDNQNTGIFKNSLQINTVFNSLDKFDISPTLKKVLTFIYLSLDSSQSTISISPFHNVELEEIRQQIQLKLDPSYSDLNLLLKSLPYQPTNEPKDINQWIRSINSLRTITENDEFLIISSMGLIICFLAETLDTKTWICSICLQPSLSSAHILFSRPSIESSPIGNEILALLNKRVTKLDQSNIILNMCYLNTFYKLYSHFQPPKLSPSNIFFTFIKQNLQSKNREVRLASAILFPLMVLAKYHIQDNNFTFIMNFLESLDLFKFEYLAETVIFIWGELATGAEGDRLRAILFKLIHFLFSSNLYQSAISFHELKLISVAKDTTCWKLLSPILPNISAQMAQKLDTKPFISQRISDLVEVSAESILERTSSNTVPYLLTYYKKDLLGKIAEISKQDKFQLVWDNRQKIVAVLVMTIPDITPNKLQTILVNSCPQIKQYNLTQIISTANVFWEILAFYSPETNNKDAVIFGLSFFLNLWNSQLPQDELISNFLKSNILGVVQCFFESIRDRKGKQASSDKLKSVYAIEFLSTISGTSIVSVLPQIYTCLTYALELDFLKEATLHCWRILIQNLGDPHVVTLLDQSIAIIIQNWDLFDRKCKQEAKRLINSLFDKSESFRLKHILTFYSVAEIDEFAEIYSKVMNAIQKQKPIMLLKDINRRCRSDNLNVAKQSLSDLSKFLNQYQKVFFSTFLEKSSFKNDIQSLLGSLFNILNKFKSNDEICIKCTKCIGLIGSLDPAKFEIERKKDQFVLPSDFEEFKERISFMLKFLNQYLVPAFWSSHYPDHQLFLAYSMQELLKLCGLSNIDFSTMSATSHEGILWAQFSEIAKSTLTPLVYSKYTITPSEYSMLKYPIFTPAKGHTKWLRLFALDLLKRASFGEVGPIFKVCSGLVKDQDISLSTFLLPYAALHLIVAGDDEHFELIKIEILNVLSYDTEQVHHMAVENLRLVYESIFNLLDYFRKWVFARKQMLKKKNMKKSDPAITKVNLLLDQIPHSLMAQRSFQSNSFERSVLYLEQCYRLGSDEAFSDSFSTLQTLYANIGDYDALDGALKKFSVKSLDDRITQLEYSDNWRMAQDCLLALGDIDSNINNMDTDTRLLKSLFDHELYDNVLEKLDLLVTDENVSKEWMDLGLEASILSGKMNYVNDWVSKLETFEYFSDNQNLINYHIGKTIVHYKNREFDKYQKSLDNVYLMLGAKIGVNKNLSLNKVKSTLVLLHSLTDFNTVATTPITIDAMDHMKLHLDQRLEHNGNDFKSSWFISSFRKTADSICATQLNKIDSSETWLKLAKISRKHNRLDLSTTSIMHAVSLNNADTDFEYAKLLWAQGDHSRALQFLGDLRDRNIKSNLTPREKAVIQLKYTKWLDLSNNSNSKKIIEEYSTAVKIDSSWEKPYYYLGRYYNKLLDLKSSGTENLHPKDISGDNEKRVVIFYAKAISFGSKYLFEALPKLLTVWMDFAESILEVPAEVSDSVKMTVLAERKKNLQVIYDEIQKIGSKLPRFYWYTVFSQLLSRLLHSDKVTAQIIMGLANNVLQQYPSHALWSVLAQFKSIQADRARKGKKILELFSSSDSLNQNLSNSSILQSAKQLFTQLMNVSKKQLPAKVRSSLSLKNDFEFDFSSTPCQLVVPVKTNFQITLPPSIENLRTHNPFPNSSNVTIAKFKDTVDVLSSMQRPRRLYLIGSDGLGYSILCKPNDDLRKDAKLMEFTTMIDQLLKKDYESEQRKLHISTYAVIPLNENHGIIEWVEHTRTMREILKTYYANIGISLDVGYIKRILDLDCDVSERAEMFKKDILAKYPPVLYQWFIENFPNPATWYDARNNYTRTTAVMSMVGYMLGLGDRHGENLLFRQDGSLFHVDFDCLFEKGLELAIPEKVPFRLTHNMVDAFGITGVDGTFKKSCEVTLQLIRNNETILMNILESFLHDPIMDWSHKRKARNTPRGALSTIRRKIRGILDQEGLPIGVQGQAEFLIQQATSLENLCQMYIGWMAFW